LTQSSKTADRLRDAAAGLVAMLLLAGAASALVAQTAAPIIDTIIVLNHNIFDDKDLATLPYVARLANAVHIKTHASVIRRTLVLNQGDPYDSARAVESERALRSLNVFRQVRVDTVHVRNRLALRVQTEDGWSTKPQLNYASSAGSVTWQVGMQEENLLGTATSLTALFTKTPDRSSGQFLYLNPHFIARRPRLALVYQPRSDGTYWAWSLGVPFYQTAAKWQFGTTGEASTYRVLIFKDHIQGQPASDSTQRHVLRFGINAGMALRATSRSYLRLWASSAWRREDFGPEGIDPPGSTFSTIGVGLEVAHTRFHVLERFNTYARREDVNLSEFLRFGVWAAPRAWGYPAGHAGIGLDLSGQLSALWPGGFIVLNGGAHGLYTGSMLDSARVRAGVTIASQNFAYQTAIVHLEGSALRGATPNAFFDTWQDQTGLRLYPAHAFTGTRTVWFTFEDRIVLTEQAFGLVGVGVAPFFDWGGAWYGDEPVWVGKDTVLLREPMRTGSDAGLALRLGPTRAVRGDVSEFAVGYRFGAPANAPHGWALSIRRGIRF
jgi:hypothetical protein